MSFDADAGKQPGLEIWRIEQMKPVRWPKEDFGRFYSGDCYLVLNTVQKPMSSALEQDLHFWLGKDSSQDERGAAAYMTVELDDSLGGTPVQHREVQGFESKEFMSLFPNLQFMDGGVDSAFNKVDRSAYQARLFHCKGKRNCRAFQVPVSGDSLNSGDVFVLDAGANLFQWNGTSADKYEKVKGLEILERLKKERMSFNPSVTILEEGKNDGESDASAFWSELGGKPASIKTAEEGGSDNEVKTQPPQLYKVSDASGSMTVEQVGEGKLERDQLDTNDCFILFNGEEVVVWVGKGANRDERKQAMNYGISFLSDKGLPDTTPVTKIFEGAEPARFKRAFHQWQKPQVLTFGSAAEAKEKRERAEIDVSAMAQRKAAKEEKMASLEGKVDIWRIEDFEKKEIPREQYGQFFRGDSYICLFTYEKNNKPYYIIYFWQGRDSSSDEKGASALLAKDLDDSMGGEPVQVRVVDGKEPNHFLGLFQGKMVVHEGGRASAYKNRQDTDSYDVDGISLFHVRGTNAMNTRAVQVAETASSLNSGDCFVLLTPDTMYVWQGIGANDSERSTAQNIADILKGNRNTELVEEGSEPEGFWAGLGGQGDYPRTKTLANEDFEPRLFHLTTATVGGLGVEEIFNFSQDDLIQEDVMLLDVDSEVFVWIGSGATKEEHDEGIKLAEKYIAAEAENSGRDPSTPIFRIPAGAEPPNFSCHFLGWSETQATDFNDPYLAKLAGFQTGGDGESKAAAPQQVSSADTGFKDPTTNKFPIEELQNGVPAGVDPSQKHLYLDDAVFQEKFGMDVASFKKLAKWKQNRAKKEHGLF